MKNEESKSLIKSKIVEYLGRAETLKEHLMTQKRGKSATYQNSLKSDLEVSVLQGSSHLYSLTMCL